MLSYPEQARLMQETLISANENFVPGAFTSLDMSMSNEGELLAA